MSAPLELHEMQLLAHPNNTVTHTQLLLTALSYIVSPLFQVAYRLVLYYFFLYPASELVYAVAVVGSSRVYLAPVLIAFLMI